MTLETRTNAHSQQWNKNVKTCVKCGSQMRLKKRALRDGGNIRFIYVYECTLCKFFEVVDNIEHQK